MKKVGFCAVSGSGMSALAQVLNFKGIKVFGSDRSFDQGKDEKNKKALTSVGIEIYPQDGSMFENDIDTLYVSTAVEDTIPDVKRAKELDISIKKRSDLLAEIFSQYKYNIAVGGTSGKSTVTAMIGYILDKLNKKPLLINGAILKNYEDQKGIPNVILNDGEYCVIEADESDGSIEKYNPYISVINNITLDHKSIDELKELFSNFAKRAQKGFVYNKDCVNSNVLQAIEAEALSFSIKDETADFYAKNITSLPDGTQYEFAGKQYKLSLIGAFNVANAMCAIATCSMLGIDSDDACMALQSFQGAKRRLEVLGVASDIAVIDDFAHNPDKVLASMSALRNYEGRLLVMFQPHGFAPMRLMGKQIIESFVSKMSNDDILLMPEIFFSGGSVVRDISSKDLIEYAKSFGKKAMFFETRDELYCHLRKIAKSGDRIVLMGARDNSITDMGYSLLDNLK